MKDFRAGLSAKRLRETVHYDPDTGIFTWLINNRRARVGAVAGSLNRAGYREITIDYVSYKAHRLAWLYMTGRWPTEYIDHRERNKDDNRWHVLREANNSLNRANSKRSTNNRSGFKGVLLYKRTGRWCARINVNKKNIHLGYFDTPEEAHEAYKKGARKYFGSFGRGR